MVSEKYFREQCFVLKNIPFKSSDAHIILYGKDQGKFMVLAKGVGKPASKLAPLLNNGNCIDVDYVVGKAGNTLTSCSSIEGFQSRYSSYEALVTGMYICDLVDQTTVIGESEELVFYLLYFCLLAMNDRNYKEIRIFFEWKYAALMGYASDDADYLREQLLRSWKTQGFNVHQQSVYDELLGFFGMFKSEQNQLLCARLSEAAYREMMGMLKRIYQNEAQIYVKSQKILEQAIGH